MKKQHLSIILISSFIFFFVVNAFPHLHKVDSHEEYGIGHQLSDTHYNESCISCELEKSLQKVFDLPSSIKVRPISSELTYITYTVNITDYTEITSRCNDPPSVII